MLSSEGESASDVDNTRRSIAYSEHARATANISDQLQCQDNSRRVSVANMNCYTQIYV